LPAEAAGARHTYYRFAVRTRRRPELKRWLSEHGIRTATAYSPCLHLSRIYSELGYARGAFPKSEAAERDTLLLPISPFLREEEREKISRRLLEFAAAR
jgi:dTDP-4-amino-4,6-dideoxygalactose transaminase